MATAAPGLNARGGARAFQSDYVDALTATVTTLAVTVNVLAETVNALQQSVTRLIGKVNRAADVVDGAAEAELAAAETKLAAANAELAAAETKLAAAETKLAAPKAELAAAETKLAAAETKLAAAKADRDAAQAIEAVRWAHASAGGSGVSSCPIESGMDSMEGGNGITALSDPLFVMSLVAVNKLEYVAIEGSGGTNDRPRLLTELATVVDRYKELIEIQLKCTLKGLYLDAGAAEAGMASETTGLRARERLLTCLMTGAISAAIGIAPLYGAERGHAPTAVVPTLTQLARPAGMLGAAARSTSGSAGQAFDGPAASPDPAVDGPAGRMDPVSVRPATPPGSAVEASASSVARALPPSPATGRIADIDRSRVLVIGQAPLYVNPAARSAFEDAVDIAFVGQRDTSPHALFPLAFIEPGRTDKHLQLLRYVREAAMTMVGVSAPVSFLALSGDFITRPLVRDNKDIELPMHGFMAVRASEAGGRPADQSVRFARVELARLHVKQGGFEAYCAAHALFACAAVVFTREMMARLETGTRPQIAGPNVSIDAERVYVYKRYHSQSARKPNLALVREFSPELLVGVLCDTADKVVPDRRSLRHQQVADADKVVPDRRSLRHQQVADADKRGTEERVNGETRLVSVVVFRYIAPAAQLKVAHVAALLRAVSKLCAARVVHGDVRGLNVLLWTGGDEARATLIDFDFAVHETKGDCYPPGFSHQPRFPNGTVDVVRHPAALANEQMRCVHDAYAVARLACYFVTGMADLLGLLTEMVAGTEHNEVAAADCVELLNSAAAKLDSHAERELSKGSFVRAPNNGTGSPPTGPGRQTPRQPSPELRVGDTVGQ